MAELLGMLTMEELRREVQERSIDTVAVVFSDLYGRLLGKRYDADHFVSDVVRHGSHACDYLLTTDMAMEPVQGYAYTNWEKGYGDFHLIPDMGTLRVAAWLNRTALVICDVTEPDTHAVVPVAPRSILREAIARAEDAGYWAMAASELEYYLFRDSYMVADNQNFAQLQPYSQHIEDYHMLQATREEVFHGAARRALKESGVPVESSKGEWGKGQHELNIRYTDILGMADRHAVFKQCLKELAELSGNSVTFMAKFDSQQAGSSCHVHLSLWNDFGNVFVGDEPLDPDEQAARFAAQNPKGKKGRATAQTKKADAADSAQAGFTTSPEFRWFLGGLLTYLPDFMVFYAPTVNSYKRYLSGSWAPTRVAWSRDNRTAGFRVVGRNQNLRIESRVPGADCNPYLTYAAALYAGLEGIANQIEPPAPFDGDIYQAKALPSLPQNLREATQRFSESKFVRRVLGDDVTDHYTHFFLTEQAAFDQAVTDWERRRYFEQI